MGLSLHSLAAFRGSATGALDAHGAPGGRVPLGVASRPPLSKHASSAPPHGWSGASETLDVTPPEDPNAPQPKHANRLAPKTSSGTRPPCIHICTAIQPYLPLPAAPYTIPMHTHVP